MTTTNLTPQTPLYEIALIIHSDWKKVYFGAKPYLEAMACLDSINDKYIFDDAKSIVNYFLANASTWKGDTAKVVKAHLKSLVK